MSLMDSEDKEECQWELELLEVNSLLDLLRLAAASSSIAVLIEFWSNSLNERVIGTFANNYGAAKPDMFSYTIYKGNETRSFLIYKADEGGEQFNFSDFLSAGSMTFPLIKLSREPKWFSERIKSYEGRK